jgi:hypothetical protein
MRSITLFSAMAFIFSFAAADVQEQNKGEDSTDSPLSVRLEPEVKMEDNYPNPF